MRDRESESEKEVPVSATQVPLSFEVFFFCIFFVVFWVLFLKTLFDCKMGLEWGSGDAI